MLTNITEEKVRQYNLISCSIEIAKRKLEFLKTTGRILGDVMPYSIEKK